MKNTPLLLILICLFFYACQPATLEYGIAEDYLPTSQLLQSGVVNKYYTHTQPSDNPDISTIIEYQSYEGKGNRLVSNFYNPDFKPYIRKEYLFKNNQMSLDKEWRFARLDTIQANIMKSVSIDWMASSNESKKSVTYDWGTRSWETVQEGIRDTVMMDKPAKIFSGRQITTTIWKGDTTTLQQKYKRIYVKDIGLFHLMIEGENGKLWMELVEQIPLENFKKQALHGIQRVAYIDTTQIMDKGEAFKICKENSRIYDYYNGQQLLHYKGGKKAIWKIVKEHIEPEKLFKESGYLTFRFVVNCKGETGHFITEQAALDYQKKEFNAATVAHFYQIVRKIKDWIPTKTRGENVNAYFYLSFKLKEGKLIEILP